jgi:predicted nuclease of predicted toxin-antitoxin system
MTITLYMDHHVERAITTGLRVRGVDVLTAYEDGADRLTDAELLDRATASGRVLFTRDDDLLSEANKRQRSGTQFSGVIYAHLQTVDVGTCVLELEIVAQAGAPEDLLNRVEYLPL